MKSSTLFVVLAMIASGRGRSADGGYEGLQAGEAPQLYSLITEVLLSETGVHLEPESSVGYQIQGQLQVSAVWQGDVSSEKLLKFKLVNPKLHVKSKRARFHDDFVEHASILDTVENNPFYAIWTSGKIKEVYIGEKEPLTLINYKKGLISLFQFQILDGEVTETDVADTCQVEYNSISQTIIRKHKTHCDIPLDTLGTSHPERMLSLGSTRIRQVDYEMSDNLKVLKAIVAQEVFSFQISMKEDTGNKLVLLQHLTHLNNVESEKLNVKAKTAKDAIEQLTKNGPALKEQSLSGGREPYMCKGDCPTLSKLVKDNRDSLKSSELGTVKSATAFIQLLRTARQSTPGEILKALKGAKNKEILKQLCDLVGLTQTIAAHQAAKKFLHFDSEYDIDNVERYIWALSTGSQPKEEVINDLLKISENSNIPKKIFESLTLGVSSMAHNFAQKYSDGINQKIVIKVKNHIVHMLSKCTDNECKIIYMRALKNLRHPETLEIILEHALKGDATVSVAAMKAMKAIPEYYRDSYLIKECEKIFYQLDKRYDESARTLAVDIILDTHPSNETVRDLVMFLTRDEKKYEVKQFLYQKLNMKADKCPVFRVMLMGIIKQNNQVNNWNVLAQRGLSTAFSRPFMNTEWMNGSLVSVQEISGGILKRGHVDVVIESYGEQKELFSLGLFAGGMSSFVGSGGSEEEPAEIEEPANAGMELTVQGSQIRPFIFFNGQGELMGHVWSGTASERTTAFQAMTLLHDHTEWLILGNGATAELNLVGVTSFDLAGQIQLSIWNRVAHSVIEKSAGIALQGGIRVDTPLIQTHSEFSITAEPKLNLVLDTDFYSDISLCIQVKQPDMAVKHDVHKTEFIPNSKYRLRKSLYKTVRVPGKTYVLNRKNSMMCNVIHNK